MTASGWLFKPNYSRTNSIILIFFNPEPRLIDVSFLKFFVVAVLCSVIKLYHSKIAFGGRYSYCRQYRHADILSLPPIFFYRKFYSCPRLSAFYLSYMSESERYLRQRVLLSELTFLKKCRTLIYTMEPTKRKHVLLTTEHQFQVVSRTEAAEIWLKWDFNQIVKRIWCWSVNSWGYRT